MSYQEKRSVTNIISTILLTGIYALVMYNNYSNWGLDADNVFRFWAIVILIFIPISIIARIIILIIFHILESIVNEVKGGGELDEMDIVDERDKLIEMKAAKNSMFVFAIGFMIALGTQLFDVSNHVFFLVLVLFGVISDILSESLTICYYRKGV